MIGDGGIEILRVAPIDEAGPGEITFFTNPRYLKFLSDCRASAVIVGSDIDATAPSDKAFLQVPEPYVAFAKILQLFNPPAHYRSQVSPLAHIEPSARVEEEAAVFPGVYIG